MKSDALALAAALLPLAGPQAQADDLTTQLDCLRESHIGLASAHRGRLAPEAPENSLSGLQAAWQAGIRLLEVDVAATREGKLVLLHDDTLDRTTTGAGPVSEIAFERLKSVSLKDAQGKPVPETVPSLVEALRWAKKAGAWLQLDVKRKTRFEDVIAAVQSEGMTGQVVIITYSLKDALKVHRLEPQVMISAPIWSAGDLTTLQQKGFDLTRLIAFTGTRTPNPALWAALRREGVEAIFGTLGPEETRLDEAYLADGNPSEYADLVRQGVTIVATDRPAMAQQALDAALDTCIADTKDKS
ncbi:glycerophosphodiester phosphodiesterase family protein [Pedomonas mirosovicensis]|uniref:glycerophosphodiester phosphodiesterase family protein n=1 Tax=Pedomonas mirosovicensis TaxID=2908641 RepID=UPI0021679848|nr:glycerophosphodiester phosphodiesterase family protein [Pedomonas mirosovicensis]MCH8684107.1 glycerophosphodiester phosphodiesterase family protein [Pedomonas mirosovicensis]